MNELRIIVNHGAGTIDFNYEELKARVIEGTAQYRGAVFHEDTVDCAKSEIAYLRKQLDILETERKGIKNEFMIPYLNFEAQIRDVGNYINTAIAEINEQLVYFEEKRKADKKVKIQEIYDKVIGEVREFLPLEKIYNLKWENKTYLPKKIQEEIVEVGKSVVSAVKTLQAMSSEAVPQAIEMYKKDLSLTNAIAYISRYDKQQAEILERERERQKREEEQKRQAELDRVRREEKERFIEEARIVEVVREQTRADVFEEIREEHEVLQKTLEINETPTTEKEIRSFFVITATPSELEQIEIYMNSIGVIFERNDA